MSVHPIRPKGSKGSGGFIAESNTKAPLEGGGNPPHDGDMEARIAKLEVATEYIQRDVAEVRVSVERIANEASGIKERLATIEEKLGHMPSTVAMWTSMAVATATLLAGIWAIANLVIPPIVAAAVLEAFKLP